MDPIPMSSEDVDRLRKQRIDYEDLSVTSTQSVLGDFAENTEGWTEGKMVHVFLN